MFSWQSGGSFSGTATRHRQSQLRFTKRPCGLHRHRKKTTAAEGQQPGSVSHTHHPDDGHSHESVSSEVSTDISETLSTADAAPPERNPTSSLKLTDADPAALEHAALHVKLERVGKEFGTILAEINEKYPEVREVQSLSYKELHKRYPTQASQDALNERFNQMRDEFKDRAIQLLSELPTEIQLELIIRIDDHITDTLGDDRANEMTAELLSKLKL